MAPRIPPIIAGIFNRPSTDEEFPIPWLIIIDAEGLLGATGTIIPDTTAVPETLCVVKTVVLEAVPAVEVLISRFVFESVTALPMAAIDAGEALESAA